MLESSRETTMSIKDIQRNRLHTVSTAITHLNWMPKSVYSKSILVKSLRSTTECRVWGVAHHQKLHTWEQKQCRTKIYLCGLIKADPLPQVLVDSPPPRRVTISNLKARLLRGFILKTISPQGTAMYKNYKWQYLENINESHRSLSLLITL